MSNHKLGLAELESILRTLKIKSYDLNIDGTVNVYQDVNLSYKKLSELPFAFGIVDGHFSITNNKITSFKGFPKTIEGIFDCSYNQISSWEHFPQVEGKIYLNHNLFHEIPDFIIKIKEQFSHYSKLEEEIKKRQKTKFILDNLK